MTDAAAVLRFTQKLAVIVLVALALRIGIRLVLGTQTYWVDGYGHYASLAQSLCAGHGYAFPGQGPTAFRVPLYPMFIALTTCGQGSPWPLIVAQALASSLTCLLAGLIARRMAGDGAGLLAAAIYALWPYAAWHDVSLQESGLHAFLAALATWLLIRLRDQGGIRRAMICGAALGLLLLTRSTMLPFAVVALVMVAVSARGAARLLPAIIAAAAMIAVLSPWLAWQKQVTGAYGLGTEGGAALYAGNHRLTFSAYPERSIDESRANVFAALTPAEQADLARHGAGAAARDAWFRGKAIKAIAANPTAFVSGACRKLWAAFGPMPTPRHGLIGDLGYAVIWTPFVLAALAGMVLRRRLWRDDLMLHAHLLTFCATTTLFWAQTSHRSYLDPYLAVFAACALMAIAPQSLRKWLSR